jgi:hypothetical protein
LYADLFVLLRLQVAVPSEVQRIDSDLGALMIATGRRSMGNASDQHCCVRNVRLLAELFRRGVANPPTVDAMLHLLADLLDPLADLPQSLDARLVRASVVSELLAGVGPEYPVKPSDSRRLRGLMRAIPSPTQTTAATGSPHPPLWATLITPQPALPFTFDGEPSQAPPPVPPQAQELFIHQPYSV